MNEVKTKIYLNALKIIFPYDNKVIGKLINPAANESEAQMQLSGTSNKGAGRIELCSRWLSHVFHNSQKSELQKLGLTEMQIAELLKCRRIVDPEAEYALLLKEKISLINRFDADYPKLLGEIHDAPEILYLQGQKSMLINQKNTWNIAIVGTRAPSAYGMEITGRIVKDLASYGPTIVSGLAMGIDQAAHEAAVERGLSTIAVLGAGHGSLKPKTSFRLIKKLLSEHLIISEYPYNVKGSKFTFPQRNRIICGLSLATMVVEARSRSGALITAQLASDSSREVFAVPGSILSEYSKGTNGIIQKGEAELFMDVPTMIESINLKSQLPLDFKDPPTGSTVKKITPEISCPLHKKIYDHLKHPMGMDEFLPATGINVQEMLVALTELELQGFIKETPDQKWMRCSK